MVLKILDLMEMFGNLIKLLERSMVMIIVSLQKLLKIIGKVKILAEVDL